MAVKRENDQCQAVMKKIRKQIEVDTPFLESYELGDGSSLMEIIETIDFKEAPPRYLSKSKPVFNFFDQRFDIEHLISIYN